MILSFKSYIKLSFERDDIEENNYKVSKGY